MMMMMKMETQQKCPYVFLQCITGNKMYKPCAIIHHRNNMKLFNHENTHECL